MRNTRYTADTDSGILRNTAWEMFKATLELAISN